MSIPITNIKWKLKPNRKKKDEIEKKFHEKSKYVNDMLTFQETIYHEKSNYKVDPKTSLHMKSSYKLDKFL
jgi:hypothetical protein